MERPPVHHGDLGDFLGRRKRRAGLEGIHVSKEADSLFFHLSEVARDAAIVANQAALLFFGIFHVRVMHEAADRLSAWGA
jgi:hypothetical protein